MVASSEGASHPIKYRDDLAIYASPQTDQS
jgi:hypothetical protein